MKHSNNFTKQLQGLRLTGMAKAVSNLLSLAHTRQEDAHPFLALMCQQNRGVRRGTSRPSDCSRPGNFAIGPNMEEIIL